MQTLTLTCKKCPGDKVPSDFRVRKDGKKVTTCIECERRIARERRAIDPEASRLYSRAKNAEFRERNKGTEKHEARKAEQRGAGPFGAEYQRKWRESHPGKQAEYGLTYYWNHRDLVLASNNVRRRHLEEDGAQYVLILSKDPCAYCHTYTDICIDHIEPVRFGGAGDSSNLTAACRICNLIKREHPLLLFLLSQN